MHALGRALMFAVGMAAAPMAGAVSLDEVRVQSTLGMPLRAQVAYQAEPDDLVSAACIKLLPGERNDPGLFGFAGGWVKVDSHGRSGVIRIGNTRGINEPVLKFSLLFDCGAGRLVRDYTVLIDPVEPQFENAEPKPAMPPAAIERALPARRKPLRALPTEEGEVVLPGVTRRNRARAADDARLQLSHVTPNPLRMDRRPAERGFELKLSSELDPAFLQRKSAATASANPRDPMKAVRDDDSTAEMLRLNNQIDQLEKQLAEMRARVTAAPEPAPASAAKASASPKLGVISHSGIQSNWNTWGDYVIWLLGGAVLAGLGYIFWLYRARHGANSMLSDHWNDTEGFDIKPAANIQPREKLPKGDIGDGLDFGTARDSGIIVDDRERWAIEEAQIFLKQGWKEQAIALLDDEITRSPYQLDVWLMLFDIFHKEHDRDRFAHYAERFRSLVRGLPIWNSIREMGLAIDPENPLYSTATT